VAEYSSILGRESPVLLGAATVWRRLSAYEMPEHANVVRERQLQDLKRVLAFVRSRSPFYRALHRGVTVRDWDDVQRLPVISKGDVRARFGEILTSRRWAEMYCTSGTSGEPFYVPFSRRDWSVLGRQAAETFALAGLERSDIVHIAFPMASSMWGSGIDAYRACAALGCFPVRFGPGHTNGQIRTIRDLGATVLYAMPSHALKIALTARDAGCPEALKSVRLLICTDEPIARGDLTPNDLGSRLQALWEGREIRSTYGSSELGNAGAECECHLGFHTTPWSLLFEVLHPERLTPVKEGEIGVLTVTTLTPRALPLIRYNTGDLARLFTSPCLCKRRSPRIGPIIGRTDGMFKVRGVTLYPEMVQGFLSGLEGVEDYFIEAADCGELGTVLKIAIRPTDDKAIGDRRFESRVRDLMREHLRVAPEVLSVCARELEMMRAPSKDGGGSEEASGAQRKPCRFRRTSRHGEGGTL
jgi:phenylacetate-CoA ligase